MMLLRREYLDGPESPELVLLHGTAFSEETGERLARVIVVMPPGAGRREAVLRIPDPPGGGGVRVRYAYTAVSRGSEWRSPEYELRLHPAEPREDLSTAEETPPGNLRPAPGLGTFRLRLPLRSPARGVPVRYGFGAMRKKPTDGLCRVAMPPDPGGAVSVDAPEALSVLKERPMPYFLHHLDPADGRIVQDKIASARITFPDPEGDVVAVRLLWGDPAWETPNLSVMELKGYRGERGRAADQLFAEDPAAFAEVRREILAARPLPRVFEAYLYGVEGSEVEYCFQWLRARPDGSLEAGWRNREGGGNWRITL